jgi:mycofactocin system glycosyltransferase
MHAPYTDLPEGFTVRLDRRTQRLSGVSGNMVALLGGSPARVLWLPAAAPIPQETNTFTVGDEESSALARQLLDGGFAHPVVDAPGTPPGPSASHVTVVVPIRDRPAALTRLLDGLAETASGIAEVIVVDDGSDDPVETRRVCARTGARLICHPYSRGPAAARNSGLAAVSTDLIAFLDSDVRPEPGWLPPLLAHLVDPSVALVAPRVVALASAEHPGWPERYERQRPALDLGCDPAPVAPHTRIAFVPGAAMIVRRSALGSAGFAEDLQVGEDVDLVLRLCAAGWRLRYVPSARAAHEHRLRAVDRLARQAFYGSGGARLARRHPGAVPPAVFEGWQLAVCALVGGQRRVTVLSAAALTLVAVAQQWLRLGRSGSRERLAHPGRVAAQLTGVRLCGAVNQAVGLLIRHWWPLAGLGCAVSHRARKVALVAVLADGLLDWYQHHPATVDGAGLDPIRYLLIRRLDDLSYGTGLWYGAYRGRTFAPLLPLIGELGSVQRSYSDSPR